MATDAKQLELPAYRWEDDHYAVPQRDGRILVGWNWFREHLGKHEVERMVGILQAALCGAEEAAPEFEAFWTLYPFRNGKRHKKEAMLCWDAMGTEELRLLLVAAKHYAAHVGRTAEMAPDVFRWMGFTYSRATNTVRRVKGEAPWREWATNDKTAPERPQVGPYAVYREERNECGQCGGCGLITIRHPKDRSGKYTAGVRCPCPVGQRMAEGIPVFQKGKDVVA